MTKKQLARILICVFVAFWVASGVILALYDFGFFGCTYVAHESGDLDQVIGKARGHFTFPTEVNGIKITDITFVNFGDFFEPHKHQNRVTSITVPDGITKLSSSIHMCENLKELYLGKDLEDISMSFFLSRHLEKIYVSPDNPYYHMQDGCLMDSRTNDLILAQDYANIPDGTRWILTRAYSGRNMNADLMIPRSVEYIDEFVFVSCAGLKNVYIPDSGVIIYTDTFYNIPEDVHFWFEADSIEDVNGKWIATRFPEDRLHFGVEMPK